MSGETHHVFTRPNKNADAGQPSADAPSPARFDVPDETAARRVKEFKIVGGGALSTLIATSALQWFDKIPPDFLPEVHGGLTVAGIIGVIYLFRPRRVIVEF